MNALQRLRYDMSTTTLRTLAIGLIVLAFVLLVAVHPWAFWSAFIPGVVFLALWLDRKII